MGKLYYIRSLPRHTPDMPPLVRRAILTNCNRMIHQPGPVPWVGINTFDYLGRQIPRFPQQYGPKRAALHLAQLIRMMEEIGTGGAGFRYIYAYFLEQAADICANPVLQTASQEMTAIGDQWRQLASQCVKQCRRPSEQGCAQIAAFLREIADREEKLWRGLLHIAK